MSDQSETVQALGRAGRRVAFHLIQALIEGLKAAEAIMEEISAMRDKNVGSDQKSKRTRIEIE
jgi:hypothetical protein